VSLSLKTLYRNARLALWRRHGYRRKSDILKDFLLRTTADFYSKGGHPPVSWPIRMYPRRLDHPVYLRLADSDFMVLDEIFSQNEYARIQDWDLPSDAKIIDLGANVGLAGLYFASMYPDSKLVAVEPDAGNCRLIERNCQQLLDDDRLRLFHAFAACSDGVAGIDKGWQAWAFRKVDTVDATHTAVPCISIPTLLKKTGLGQVDLLKCDIEGSEREVFHDCGSWIGRVRHLVVETHNPYFDPEHPYTVQHLYADLHNAGWDFDVSYELQERLVGIAFLKSRAGKTVMPSCASEPARPSRLTATRPTGPHTAGTSR
jgi:FkbM family methyltransferase